MIANEQNVDAYMFPDARYPNHETITLAELADIKDKLDAVKLDANEVLCSPIPYDDMQQALQMLLRAQTLADMFDGIAHDCRACGRSEVIIDRAAEVERAARSMYRAINMKTQATTAYALRRASGPWCRGI